MAKAKKRPFDVSDFLSKMDGGRTLQTFRKTEKFFAQADPADAVFYIQEGKVKVFVVSQQTRRRWLRCTVRATSSAKAA